MFVLKTKSTYRWPVTFKMPNGSGEMQECDFTAEFSRVPQAVIDAFITDGSMQEKLDREKSLTEVALVGWHDVQDAVGDPLAFSDEAKAQLLSIPGVRAAVVRAYFDSLAGISAKN